MIERTSFDTPTLPRLAIILGELERGVVQIPAFQRPSVWRDEQRLNLLDSIVKGLPIGSFLVWRSGKHELQTYGSVAGIPVPRSPSGLEKRSYLIDGHQRISTLFGALVRPPPDLIRKEAHRWPLYYELGSGESPAFRLPPRGEKSAPSHWLPLDILLEGRALFKFRSELFQAGQDELAEEAERVANVFKDYIIPVVPLVTENLDLVTDAFVRINSQGSAITEAHMLRALTYLKPDIDTDKAFGRIKAALGPMGFGDLPDQVLVNSLKAIFGLDVYRASVTELNEKLKTSEDKPLEMLKDALIEAVKLLRSIGVLGWGALPYAYQLVTLATLAARAPGSLETRRVALERWFWRTTYAEHYTGQTGGQIRRDIDTLADAEGDDLIAHGAEVRGLNSPIRQGTVRMKAHLLFLATRPTNDEAKLRRQQALADSLAGEPGRRGLPRLVPGSKPKPGNLFAARKDEIRRIQKLITEGTLTEEEAREHLLSLELVGVKGTLDEALVTFRAAQIVEAERAFVSGLGLRVSDVVEEEPDTIEDDED